MNEANSAGQKWTSQQNYGTQQPAARWCSRSRECERRPCWRRLETAKHVHTNQRHAYARTHKCTRTYRHESMHSRMEVRHMSMHMPTRMYTHVSMSLLMSLHMTVRTSIAHCTHVCTHTVGWQSTSWSTRIGGLSCHGRITNIFNNQHFWCRAEVILDESGIPHRADRLRESSAVDLGGCTSCKAACTAGSR